MWLHSGADFTWTHKWTILVEQHRCLKDQIEKCKYSLIITMVDRVVFACTLCSFFITCVSGLYLPLSAERVCRGERLQGGGGRGAEAEAAGGQPAEERHWPAEEQRLRPLRPVRGRELCLPVMLSSVRVCVHTLFYFSILQRHPHQGQACHFHGVVYAWQIMIQSRIMYVWCIHHTYDMASILVHNIKVMSIKWWIRESNSSCWFNFPFPR